MPVRTVYLVRHGDTAANAATPGPERERGWKPYPLDDAGRREANRLATKLSRLGIKALVSSDLTRAKQTAEIIGDRLGMKPDFISALRTWNTGELAGQLKSKCEPEIARLVRNAPDRAPPGGESFNQFCGRIFKGLHEALEKHSADPVAIIIHARIERLIAGWKAAGSPKTHKIDPDVFLAKPEQPGHIEKWNVSRGQLSG